MCRFEGKELIFNVKVMKWHDNEFNTDFFDLWLNGQFECRYSSSEELAERLKLVIIGG